LAFASVACQNERLATPIPLGSVPWGSGDLLAQGKLVVCSDLALPPQDMGTSAKPTGTDIELAAGIAHELGLTVEIRVTARPDIPSALDSGRCDMALSALDFDSPGLKGFLTTPYMQLSEVLLVPQPKGSAASGLDALCGRRLAVLAGSVEDAVAEGTSEYTGRGLAAACGDNKAEGPTVRSYATESDAIEAVQGGQADGFFVDAALAAYETQEHAGEFAQIANVTSYRDTEAVAIRQTKSLLSTVVWEALRAIDADGSFLKIMRKYGITPLAGPIDAQNGATPGPSQP